MLFIALGCNNSANKTGNDISETPGQNEAADSNPETPLHTKQAPAMYDIKAAKIVFNCTGGPEVGTETLYFDDYGTRAVLVVDKKHRFGRNNQTSIWQDKKTTMINHETRTVTTSPFRVKATEAPGIADLSAAGRNGIGYEKMPDKIIAGKTCEVWYNAKQNFKYYLWKKIGLKEEFGKDYIKEAISVDEIAAIPPSVMVVPDDYKQ